MQIIYNLQQIVGVLSGTCRVVVSRCAMRLRLKGHDGAVCRGKAGEYAKGLTPELRAWPTISVSGASLRPRWKIPVFRCDGATDHR